MVCRDKIHSVYHCVIVIFIQLKINSWTKYLKKITTIVFQRITVILIQLKITTILYHRITVILIQLKINRWTKVFGKDNHYCISLYNIVVLIQLKINSWTKVFEKDNSYCISLYNSNTHTIKDKHLDKSIWKRQQLLDCFLSYSKTCMYTMVELYNHKACLIDMSIYSMY